MPIAIDPAHAVDAAALRRADALLAHGGHGDARRDDLARVARASDFALDALERQPARLARLLDDDGASAAACPPLPADAPGAWAASLRRHRAAESTRLVWRDVLGLDGIDDTLAGATRLAEDCLRAGLDAVSAHVAARHGHVRAAQGHAVRLVVFGLGKLGGGELNFSSDIDIVYAFEEGGTSDGARPLDADTYFARIGQQLARLLDEVTADGFCHRVDLRLRPYGTAGRLAWSFAAIEQYMQREGRDWERYAWQKARPVAGDIEAGMRLLETLRPFVYRRYLDFGALDGLRAMKASIDAEVARADRADDLKRGPGGIREIEFLAQALQLIHGGRDAALRTPRLRGAFAALVDARLVQPAVRDRLMHAYRALRHVENRVQMLADAQAHALPRDAVQRARIARALGCDDGDALAAWLQPHRDAVAAEFAALLAARGTAGEVDAGGWAAAWRSARAQAPMPPGFADTGFDGASAEAALRDFAASPGVQALAPPTAARLDRVLPALLAAAAASRGPDTALRHGLALLRNVLRRSAYLALLDEVPAALARLVDVLSHGTLLAERLVAHPVLLDELLDARVEGPMPGREALHAACAAVPGEDTEAVLQALGELRQALSFRIALALRDGRQDATQSAAQLAWLADAVVARVLRQARADLVAAHGAVPGERFALLGYGSLGGGELGFGSDLDLVFLFDAPAGAHSDGARALDAARWCARLAQKVVALLSTPTAAGRLFDVDVRLRPDGAKGLLVSSLPGFADYQRARAWTWEHQALVRARCVAGDASLCAEFEALRDAVLAGARERAQVFADVAAMRARMRAELDRSEAAAFDLKQGTGGLVDLEFLLQAWVLADGPAHRGLRDARTTPGLLRAAHDAGLLDAHGHAALVDAHATLLARGLACTLDRRARSVPLDAGIARARGAIVQAWQSAGLPNPDP
mgnify:CR=1 FL=1